jgi:hypothetical protein
LIIFLNGWKQNPINVKEIGLGTSSSAPPFYASFREEEVAFKLEVVSGECFPASSYHNINPYRESFLSIDERSFKQEGIKLSLLRAQVSHFLRSSPATKKKKI